MMFYVRWFVGTVICEKVRAEVERKSEEVLARSKRARLVHSERD
jgi:hypothetical protein